ncbi:hypothetical protein [Pantoea stewartii]|uniref:hypothetical protein n=1 Tax=Pantoea stewartii TaxID=66269 RepID=UPI001CF7B3F5|nr:hypothetical protein [Pantoea stewartii]
MMMSEGIAYGDRSDSRALRVGIQSVPAFSPKCASGRVWLRNVCRFIANGYLLDGPLRRVLPDWHSENTTPMTLWAITLPNRLLPLKTRVFIDDFMAWLKSK